MDATKVFFILTLMVDIYFSLHLTYELYKEHDPFLCPPQPSNPWISDDATIWMLNTAL